MFALSDSTLFAALLAVPVFLIVFAKNKEFGRAFWTAFFAFVPTWVVVWIAEYLCNVTYVGLFGGYSFLCWPFVVGLAGAGLISLGYENDEESKFGTGLFFGSAVAAVALWLICEVGTHVIFRMGTAGNTVAAQLGNIKDAPKDAKMSLPDTDGNEMIVTDRHLAYNRAHSVLGAGGNNIGSYYEINEEEGAQQWIAGRNYFVWPLELNGWTEQEGFLTQQRDCSPGYIAVPADDNEAEPKMETGLCLKYMPGSYFSLNLQRYVYSHGYDKGDLDDPTIELDDNWHPYFTITYVTPAPQFVNSGHVVSKVLVVDPATGDIKPYDPAHTPEWVDRVTSESLVKGWANDFALYHANPNYFNSNNGGQLRVDSIRLINTHGQRQVWQIPLISNRTGARSTNGIILFDSRSVQGTFYTTDHEASGLSSESALEVAFENVSQNTRSWKVEHIQWYQIRGVPTWMAIYTKDQTGKDGQAQTVFAGIGFLDARDANSTVPSFGTTKEEALDNYYSFLASHDNHGGRISEEVTPVTITGIIYRVGQGQQIGNHSEITLALKGDQRIFVVPENLSEEVSELIPITRDGDQVTLTFGEPVTPTGARRTVSQFKNGTVAEALKPEAAHKQ